MFLLKKSWKKADIKQFAGETFKPQKNLEEIVHKTTIKQPDLLGYKTTSIFEEKDLATLRLLMQFWAKE
jgi:hypothetical protein